MSTTFPYYIYHPNCNYIYYTMCNKKIIKIVLKVLEIGILTWWYLWGEIMVFWNPLLRVIVPVCEKNSKYAINIFMQQDDVIDNCQGIYLGTTRIYTSMWDRIPLLPVPIASFSYILLQLIIISFVSWICYYVITILIL